MFQADRFAEGAELIFSEDGSRVRVRLEKKVRVGNIMHVNLAVLKVERGPRHRENVPRDGEILKLSETGDAGLNLGWTLSEF